MESIQVKAYAKINLGLDVLHKRPDGYHEVRMVMQTIRLFDKLIIKMTHTPGIAIKTNLSYLPCDENNLIYRAASLFFKATNEKPGIHVTLDKHIPVAAGLAGGSSDAAATLTALNELYHTGFSLAELQEFGVRLGADVPYCLLQGAALSEGIGELLTPLPAPPSAYCLIVKPPISVSTRYVYEHLALDTAPHPDIDALLSALAAGSLPALAAALGNTLESVTIPLHPEIAKIKQQLVDLGALGALMSGSGPTVFALFSDRQTAEHAFYHFKISEYGRQTYLTGFWNR
ncbi:MAG: 4-(cytidine 5'-diphospho)-2-C-methyl-D-erythritol kinase [Lachnospiraceae bacterium]|nr:4-(cytidine 5'-diphospho)-2-C-methyl-D-erythritol kinase [Lachnospiraceae bacterium]